MSAGSGGSPKKTSLWVAEKFEKRHADVLRAIRELECSEEFSRRNFKQRDYVDPRGKTQPMVEMTRDGFWYLAMSFTGPKAADWKVDLLEARNALETGAKETVNIADQMAPIIAGFRSGLAALPDELWTPKTSRAGNEQSTGGVARPESPKTVALYCGRWGTTNAERQRPVRRVPDAAYH